MEALILELAEEIRIVPVDYHLSTRIDNHPAFLYETYLIRSWSNDVSNQAPNEHSELGWFTVEQARQLNLADKRYLFPFDSLLTNSADASVNSDFHLIT